MSKDSQIFINSRGDGRAGAPSTMFQSLIYPASESSASLPSIPQEGFDTSDPKFGLRSAFLLPTLEA